MPCSLTHSPTHPPAWSRRPHASISLDLSLAKRWRSGHCEWRCGCWLGLGANFASALTIHCLESTACHVESTTILRVKLVFTAVLTLISPPVHPPIVCARKSDARRGSTQCATCQRWFLTQPCRGLCAITLSHMLSPYSGHTAKDMLH